MIFGNWFNPAWSEAFAWAWLHSWWQGALALGVYAGAGRLWPDARARYAAGCALLLLALALPLATFYKLVGASASSVTNPNAFKQLPPDEQLARVNDMAARETKEARGATNTAAREQNADSLRQRAAERFAAPESVSRAVVAGGRGRFSFALCGRLVGGAALA